MNTNSRKPISKKLRFEVFKRDGFTCQYCGAVPPTVVLEPDHINPVCNGGDNSMDNLITSCFNCNRGKAGIPLTVIPKSLADKAAEIREREEQIAGYREVVQASLDRIENDMWEVAEALYPGCSESGINRKYLQSIKVFVERLPLHLVIDAAEIANTQWFQNEYQKFLYFCGICWNRIKGQN
jgi:hypothetical protein